MAAPIKSSKKVGTVIHRTTSETLRLGECVSAVSAVSAASKKKSQTTSPSCSFQITGVSLTRYDLGEDSADDLDESHTDDISRVTDNETPSFSEDSRDTDEPYHQHQHNGPTNNQQPITIKPTHPTIVEATDDKWQEEQEQNTNVGLGRFKVVKIESVAPFSRGRWTCFDYLDQKTENVPAPTTSNYWENNCQHPYMFQGNYLVQENNLANNMENQKRTRNSYPASPNFISSPSIRPSFVHSTSIDCTNSVTELKQKEIEPNRNETCALQNQVPSNTPQTNSTQNINDTNKASVSCTATIDTKIEHALDVVKNHLTHAVRLEVEELKVKINELVDRISYLEYENDLLRANVAPDVLANLKNNGSDK